MPDADFYIRQGDRASTLRDVLRDAAGAAVSLQGGSAHIVIVPVGGGSPIVDATATIDQVGAGTSDGSIGKVSYSWQAGDTSVPGYYLGSWTGTFAGGAAQTLSNDRYRPRHVPP